MSSTTDPGNRSSAEIERDVERTRDKLRDTLEALRDRASPGQLFEQVLDYAKESGAPDMMRNMGRAMRENPMPLLLIGVGVGWMMFSGRGGGRDRDDGYYDYGDDHDHGRRWAAGPDGRRRMARMQDAGSSLAGRASAAVGEAASGLQENLSGAAERVGEAASGVADSARETASQVGDMASDAYRRVTRAAGSAGEGLSSMVGGQEVRRHADRGLRWMLQEQPLLLGALGLALGAAVGALVPGTETEDRLMGEAREDLIGQARDVAEEGYQSLRSAGGDARGGVAGMVQDAAHGAREAVTQAARDMAEQAKSALNEAGRTEESSKPTAPERARPDPARPGGIR